MGLVGVDDCIDHIVDDDPSVRQALEMLLISVGFAVMGYASAEKFIESEIREENAPNIAQIHINETHVKIVLEIFIQDLPAFIDLLPEEFFQANNMEAPPLEDRLKIFSIEGLQVVTEKGKRLVPSLVLGETRNRVDRASPLAGKIYPFTKQLIPGPPKDKRVYYAELIYPFSQKSKTLTFIPPLDEKTGNTAVTIGFATFHKQAIISYFNYLSQASTIRLDWEDPWYSSYENKTLQRRMKGAITSFLYIEPFEVRHEILARVKDFFLRRF